MPETLLTCPDCQTPNFLARGLAAHRGNKHCREVAAQNLFSGKPPRLPGAGGSPLTLEKLDALPPAYVAGESEDAVLGRQLTEQWERVKSARKEDLIFGAMMVRLRDRVLAPRAESKHKGSGRFAKGEGLKPWLKEHAPAVSEGVAYRLMEIAEGIAEDFHLKRVDLEMLLSAQIESLDAALTKKRLAIEEVIDGKSQRQLLLDFGRAADGRSKNPGGFRPNALILRAWLEQEYPENPEYLALDTFTDLPAEVQKRFKAEGQRYEERLSDAQKAELEFAADARAWNEQIIPAITLGIDREYYLRATAEQQAALLHALDDLTALVKAHAANAKKPKALRH